MGKLKLSKNQVSKWVAGIIVLVVTNIILTAAAEQVQKVNALKSTIDERYAVINNEIY